jgi:23S rRNA pseudouridine1911/1915/1917 synthase
LGDAVYGKSHLASVFPRQALHAQKLGLVHPVSGDDLEWQASVPPDMASLLERSAITC